MERKVCGIVIAAESELEKTVLEKILLDRKLEHEWYDGYVEIYQTLLVSEINNLFDIIEQETTCLI